VRDQLLNVEKIGNDSYQKLPSERFLERTHSIFDTIHCTNLKTFASVHSTVIQQKGKGKTSKKEDALIKRTLDITKEWGRTVDELLQYDVSTKSPLFDDKGFMTKAVKSDIVHIVESYLKEDDPKNQH